MWFPALAPRFAAAGAAQALALALALSTAVARGAGSRHHLGAQPVECEWRLRAVSRTAAGAARGAQVALHEDRRRQGDRAPPSGAKFKRAESKQTRKPKNPFGRCTRMYEALNQQLQANVKAATFDVLAARADAHAFTCRVAVLQLENARPKRRLRRYCLLHSVWYCPSQYS